MWSKTRSLERRGGGSWIAMGRGEGGGGGLTELNLHTPSACRDPGF